MTVGGYFCDLNFGGLFFEEPRRKYFMVDFSISLSIKQHQVKKSQHTNGMTLLHDDYQKKGNKYETKYAAKSKDTMQFTRKKTNCDEDLLDD